MFVPIVDFSSKDRRKLSSADIRVPGAGTIPALRRRFAPLDLDALSRPMISFPLKPDAISFGFDRLQTGVDNIRHDVFLSPGFVNATRNLAIHLWSRRTRSRDVLNLDWAASFSKERNHFQRTCAKMLRDGVHRAKLAKEPQIDGLALAATLKLIDGEVDAQFEALISRYRGAIRAFEVGRNDERAGDLRRRMARILQDEDRLFREVKKEMFGFFADIHRREIRDIRRVTFGDDAAVPENFFFHPFMWEKDPDDLFTLEHYEILLGHRLEDPDTYEALLDRMRRILLDLFDSSRGGNPVEGAPASPPEALLDDWLMDADNIDALFNCFQTRYRLKDLRRTGERKPEASSISDLRALEREQRRRLFRAYREFRQTGLLRRIVSAYEIQPLFREYCPPLVPHLLLQYMISFRMRRNLVARIRRLRKFYGRSLSVSPLKRRLRRVRWMRRRNRMAYLLRFMKDFSRYHRDIRNFHRIRTAMDAIHLVRDDRTRRLSGANHTLYEFLLPRERTHRETPIVGHVILKADVRGSTDLAYRMKRKGLNPASYFSLNFFQPISRILDDYGASKVFVEGDAMILSLFEHEDQPEHWYAVSRACGLAVRILFIVQQCNLRNGQHGLPPIELGIGVSYEAGRPTFLFDGEHRIMISSAINRADRLSGCARSLRKRIAGKNPLFNLYVYQGTSDAEANETRDDVNLRYNVNGIELNPNGFRKLREEIELKRIGVSLNGKRMSFHTGRFPLATGEYRRLVIREGRICRMRPDTLEVVGPTDRHYYEICTHPKVYERLKRHVRELERARQAGPLRMM